MMIRSFKPADEAAVIELWRQCGLTRPQNDPFKDVARKQRVQPELLLVAVIDDTVVGSVMGGYDGHRGWVYYVGVSPAHRRQGIARALLTEIERKLHEIGCPKINLQVRTSNQEVIDFYRAIGFAVDDVVSLGKRLEHD